ncbi:MAG: alpha-(1-_3)-arabinofuranosyltransferase family protein, partial [Ilumatobacteraceae bacterium]
MTVPNAHSGSLLRSTTALHVALLAALAYLPALTAAPGDIPADTKLFLYLDPGRLTADALYSWDSRQFAGWVPHQTVSYLWPSGPWYSVFSWLGVPDWIAHRLWIGTLLLVAGLGVRWVSRLLGLAPAGALVAAMFYQLSPYVLPYLSRTSTMLLPWAGLGWLIGLTIRAATRSRWRDAGVFGLVIATIGATNATAILMIAPAPALWLLHAAWARSIAWRTALLTAAKLGGISLVMSAWWISMLLVQGAFGADVLGYSETLEAVSLTSSSTEVMRGLGYWLFYVRDPIGFTTTASFEYMASGRAIAITFVILGFALLGLVATRWTSRRFAMMLVFVGVVLAVGVHPIADPSPLMAGFADNSRSSLALAMRSSTRALPLSTLGFALGLGALATAAGRTRWRARRFVPIMLAVLAVANLPVLFNGGFVDPILTRDEQPPPAWQQAADALDARPPGYRVMQLPGIEFGAFRWGYTVDPPLPGITARPLVTRDLLPLGSAGAMDLLYALDDRFQEGTAEMRTVAPIARLLGADVIWLPNDVAFDRFRTPRPESISAMFANAVDDGTGLGAATPFGPATPNVPTIGVVDEDSISNDDIGTALPAVELVPVADPQPIVRVKTDAVVVAGSGDGLIDAAAAGLLTGNELVRYAADLIDERSEAGDPIASADRVVITDSNRDRAHHWHSSQDVTGFTEDGSDAPGVLELDTSDQRIPVFADATTDDRTIAVQIGGTRAVASGYGEPFAYRPEDRAAMAVDGELATAWVVADRAEPVGEYLRVTADSPFTTMHLVQPQDRRNRWITTIDVTDSSGTYALRLDEGSRSETGQIVTLRAPSTQVTLTITATAHDPTAPANALDAVGFAEATSELGVSEEVIFVPRNVLAHVVAGQDLDIVLSRLRTRATNRWRGDPEPVLVRSFSLADARE